MASRSRYILSLLVRPVALSALLFAASGCQRGKDAQMEWACPVETDPWHTFHTSPEGRACIRAAERLTGDRDRIPVATVLVASDGDAEAPTPAGCQAIGFPATMPLAGGGRDDADLLCRMYVACTPAVETLVTALQTPHVCAWPGLDPNVSWSGGQDMRARLQQVLPVRLVTLHAARSLAQGRDREAAAVVAALLAGAPHAQDLTAVSHREVRAADALLLAFRSLRRNSWTSADANQSLIAGLAHLSQFSTGISVDALDRELQELCAVERADRRDERRPTRQDSAQCASVSDRRDTNFGWSFSDFAVCVAPPNTPWEQSQLAMASQACQDAMRTRFGGNADQMLFGMSSLVARLPRTATHILYGRMLAIFAGARALQREGAPWPPSLEAAAARAGVPPLDPLSDRPFVVELTDETDWCLTAAIDPALVAEGTYAMLKRCLPQ